jgi:hypothetical protein
MPLCDVDNRVLSKEEQKFDVLTDEFNSTTAKLTEAVPFHVLSDGQYIYLFRQAIEGTNDAVDKPDDVPIVDKTLLVDRFILSGTTLKLSREIRYQRSRHKTKPLSKKDTLAPMDVEEKPFYEPTRELNYINNLTNGSFSVLQLPTEEAEVKRWQIFYYNKENTKLNSVSINVSEDGWFDTTNSVSFINSFMEKNGLDNDFLDEVLKLIRESKDDDKIAENLKEDARFKVKLSEVGKDGLSEVVFAIRSGLVKDDFNLSGKYEIGTGMTSVFYYQQEINTDSGKPMKKNACVMLAMGVKADGDGKSYIAVLNFSVSKGGTLSRITTEDIDLKELNTTSIDTQELLDRIKELEKTIPEIKATIEERRDEYIDNIESESQKLIKWEEDKSKRITNEMITPLHSEEAILENTPNLEKTQSAVSELEAAIGVYNSAITKLSYGVLDPSKYWDITDQIEEDVIHQSSIDIGNQNYEIEYTITQKEEIVKEIKGTFKKTKIDASFKIINKFYFFQGDEFWRCEYTSGKMVTDTGYPKKINKEWEGVPNNLDAAQVLTYIGDTNIYFFKDSLVYISDPIDISQFPEIKPDFYSSNCWNMSSGYFRDDQIKDYDRVVSIDACFSFDNRQAYYFKDDMCWTQSIDEGQGSYMGTIERDPVLIKERWPELPNNIDTAFMPSGLSIIHKPRTVNDVIFIKGDRYWVYSYHFDTVFNSWPTEVDETIICKIKDKPLKELWLGLPDYDRNVKRTTVIDTKIIEDNYHQLDEDYHVKIYTFETDEGCESIGIGSLSGGQKPPIRIMDKNWIDITPSDQRYEFNENIKNGKFEEVEVYPEEKYYLSISNNNKYVAERELFSIQVNGVDSLSLVKFNVSQEFKKDDRPTLKKLKTFERSIVKKYYGLTEKDLIALEENQRELDSLREPEPMKTFLPMPIIEVDKNGLTSSGGLLKFAYTADKPFLFDDSLGRITMYFQGKNDNFFAAYFNPTISQYIECDSHEDTGLSFESRLKVDFEVKVTSAEFVDNTCSLIIKNTATGNIVEDWKYLPTNSSKVAKIMNGNNRFKLGFLAKKYTVGDSITIICENTSEFVPSEELTLTGSHSIEKDLSIFLKNNRTLIVGSTEFEIVENSKVEIKRATAFPGDDNLREVVIKIKANGQSVDSISSGQEVFATYSYDNFSCNTYHLKDDDNDVSYEDWEHNRSFVFYAKSLGSMDMMNFIERKIGRAHV